jgi:hypothetical protein
LSAFAVPRAAENAKKIIKVQKLLPFALTMRRLAAQEAAFSLVKLTPAL